MQRNHFFLSILLFTIGTRPKGLAATPDNQFVSTANRGNDDVSVISTASNTVIISSIDSYSLTSFFFSKKIQ